MQMRAAAVAQPIAAWIVGVLTGNTVGKGVDEQIADRERARVRCRRRAQIETPPPTRRCLLDCRQRSHIRTGAAASARAVATIRGQRRVALTEIVATPAVTAQWIARFDQRQQIAGQCTSFFRCA